MSESRSLTPVDASEYEAIEAAMNESARGRRFLVEFARRNRTADTDMLLQAIGRLENAVVAERADEAVGRLQGDLMDMADAIARTKAEISAINAPDQDQSRLTVASEALDAIVRATERATSDILGAAEQVQESAWTLRETGAESELCDALDRHATQIYTACSFQDLTAQRTSRIVHTLRYLEDRIGSMIAIWGRRLGEVPPAPGDAARKVAPATADLCQSDVDRFLENDARSSEPSRARTPLAIVALDDDLAFVSEQSVPETLANDAARVEAVADEDDVAIISEQDVADVETDDKLKAEAAPAGEDDDLALAFDDLDKLSIEEKIALFS